MNTIFNVSTGATEVALAAATAKTVLQIIAPANTALTICGWGIYFDGTSSSGEPVAVKLETQTTAGTMTSVTPALWRRTSSLTIQSTAAKNASAEPTSGTVLANYNIHPQSGYECWYPLGKEIVLVNGTRLGFVVTAPAVVNCLMNIWAEE